MIMINKSLAKWKRIGFFLGRFASDDCASWTVDN